MQRVPFLSYYLIIFQIVVLFTENCCREIESLLKTWRDFFFSFHSKNTLSLATKDELSSTFHLQTAVANNKSLGSLETFRKTWHSKKDLDIK